MTIWKASPAPFVVGHRGGRGQGWPPENTLDAFERARAEGATAVELDVRTSADGEVVVFHDPDLARMTGGSDARSVYTVSYEELRAIDLGGGARIALLSDVLEWARDRDVAVNVEIKYDVPSRVDIAKATVRVVRASGTDVLYSSFDPLLLGMAARWTPWVPRALLTHSDQALWATALQETIRPPFVAALHVEKTQADARALRRYASRSLLVGVWTVNDPSEAIELARLGVSWIVTDQPAKVREALSAIRT